MEPFDTLFYKLRYVTYSLLVIAAILLGSLLVSHMRSEERAPVIHSEVSTGYVAASSMADTKNIVTEGIFTLGAGLEHTLHSTEAAMSKGFRSVGSAVVQIGSFAASGSRFMAHSVNSGVTFAARSVASSLVFAGKTLGSGLAAVLHAPFRVVGLVLDTPVANALIRPATTQTRAPVIASTYSLAQNTAVLPALTPVSNAQPAAQPQPNADAAWPIHGEITTGFGVPHWPFQATHTGLDISDARPAGTTPIKPFKPGRVVETIRSYSGLGNHVIIDHGGGLTSLYGHLASISVQPGQQVDKTTTLGFEGSTGASTGTHLHFEIRVNGQPVNPLQYVNGRP